MENDILDASPNEPSEEAARFTQSDVDRIVKDRLEREKNAREKAYQKGWKEAEDNLTPKLIELQNAMSAAEAQQEWGKLAEPLVAKLLSDTKKQLPPHIADLFDRLPAKQQVEYLLANHEALDAATLKTHAKGGVPPSPTNNDHSQPADAQPTTSPARLNNLYDNF